QPDFAMLRADRCLAALAGQARTAGADLREGVTVTGVAADGDGVAVTAAGETLTGDACVIANGSWILPLLVDLRLPPPRPVRRGRTAFLEPADAAAFMRGRSPIFIERRPGTTTLGSGFPIEGEPVGVKCMLDRIGPAVDDPADDDRTILPDVRKRLT